MSDLFNLLQRLAKAGVDFVIVGGYAGVVHGCTYLTQDVDICCDFSPGNLMALQRAIADLHPVHRMTPGRKPLELTAENAAQFKNLYFDTTCLSANSTCIACSTRTEGVASMLGIVNIRLPFCIAARRSWAGCRPASLWFIMIAL